jgi:hypothetical protein
MRRGSAEREHRYSFHWSFVPGAIDAENLRAKVTSQRLVPGQEDPVEAEVDYSRETVKLGEEVPLAQFCAVIGRYFDVSVQRPEDDDPGPSETPKNRS